MTQVVNQFRRIFSDDGRGDKDFALQEAQLREANKKLFDAIDLVTKASEILSGLIQSKGLLH